MSEWKVGDFNRKWKHELGYPDTKGDPELNALLKQYRDARSELRKVADAHRAATDAVGGHGWVTPKDPKLKKQIDDLTQAVEDALMRLRKAYKDKGIYDADAAFKQNMADLDKESKAYKDAMRKLGLGETLERIEQRAEAPTRMKHLIERCEQEVLFEFAPHDLIALGPVALAGSFPIAGAAMHYKERHQDRKAIAKDNNAYAEQCHKRGGKNCRCADGFQMDDKTGKCLPSKGIKNRLKRFMGDADFKD